MIKILLYHFIFEQCLKVLFYNIFNSFVKPILSHIGVPRVFKSIFSLELMQDLQAFHGVDIGREMYETLISEIDDEIQMEGDKRLSKYDNTVYKK